MNDQTTRRTFRAAELAEHIGATLEGGAAASEVTLTGPAGLDSATADEVSFLAQENYAPLLETTRAGAVLLGPGVDAGREDLVVLRCEDPERAFTRVVLAFATEVPPLPEGIAEGAVVDASAVIGDGVRIAPGVSIGPGAHVGDGVTLHHGVRIGADVRIGAGSVVHPNAALYPRTDVGERCILHAGVVLGSEGFGFHRAEDGWKKTPQVGKVIVGDDVEIGANTAVDCARFGATRIGRGTKIDNLVHIAHNVVIGTDCLILAQVGIAGSTIVEDDVIIAGQVGIKGHARIGKGARLAAQAGVTKNVPPGEEWSGYPAGPSIQKHRSMALSERAGAELRSIKSRLRALEVELERLGGVEGSADAGGGSSEVK